MLARHIDIQVPDAHGNLALRYRTRLYLSHRLALAAYHQLRYLTDAGVFGFSGCHQLSVTENGNVVGSSHNLIQTMCDKNNGNAALSNFLHHGDELCCFTLG